MSNIKAYIAHTLPRRVAIGARPTMHARFSFPRLVLVGSVRRHKRRRLLQLEDEEDYHSAEIGVAAAVVAADTIMAKRSVQRIECIGCEKRYKPDKHHVYVLSISWSDGIKYTIHRKYTAFTDLYSDLQKALEQQYPTKNVNVPEPPAHRANLIKTDSRQKEQNEKRKKKMERYCEALLLLPQLEKISSILGSFFTVRACDNEITDDNHDDDTPSPSHSPPKEHMSPRPLSYIKQTWRNRTTHDRDRRTHKKHNSDPPAPHDVLDTSTAGAALSALPASQPVSRQGSREDGLVERKPKSDKLGDRYVTKLDDLFVTLTKYCMTENFSVEKGDIVRTLECHDNGWWLVKKCGDESQGWIPSHILGPVSNKQTSLAVPASRLSCSCPDIASDSQKKPPRQNNRSSYSPARPKGKSDPSIELDNSNRPIQLMRPRSRTSQGYSSDDLYATVEAPPLSDGRRLVYSCEEPDPGTVSDDGLSEGGYASFKEFNTRFSDEDDDPYSMADDEGHDDDVRTGRGRDVRPGVVYATVNKDRNSCNDTAEGGGTSQDDPDYESITYPKRDSDNDDVYATVDKPKAVDRLDWRDRPKIVLSHADSIGNSVEDLDDEEKVAPALPMRRYSFSDIETIVGPDMKTTTTISRKNSKAHSLQAPGLQEKRTRSFVELDEDKDVYEYIFPQSRSGSKSSRSSNEESKSQTRTKNAAETLPPEVAAELKHFNYYHGPLSTASVSNTLNSYCGDGDFLIRPIISKAGEICVSMKDGSNVRNFPIKFLSPGRLHFAKHDFSCIASIIQHYQERAICLSKVDKRPICLQSAICRETNSMGEDKITFNTML